jgi:elongation factor P
VISTNQFKTGTHIEVDGTIYRIMDFQHVKPGKGSAFVRTKLKRVGDGNVVDKTFRAGEKFRPVRTETKKMQYLYDSGDASVPATLETGVVVQVPLFVNEGDRVRVDTRSGEYVSRA